MKRRTRTQPTNPYYSNEPAVSTKAMADRPLVQNASLGSKTPKGVPHHPGRMAGVAGFADSKKPREKRFQPISAKVPSKTAKGVIPSPAIKTATKHKGSTKGHMPMGKPPTLKGR
jgi:hypothetical protein